MQSIEQASGMNHPIQLNRGISTPVLPTHGSRDPSHCLPTAGTKPSLGDLLYPRFAGCRWAAGGKALGEQYSFLLIMTSGEATTEPRARDDAIIPEEKVGASAVSSTPETVSCFHSFRAGMSIACPRYSRTRWRHNPRFFVTLNTIICFADEIGTAMKKFYLED